MSAFLSFSIEHILGDVKLHLKKNSKFNVRSKKGKKNVANRKLYGSRTDG